MSKARYIIESIDRGTSTSGRAKDILAMFELDRGEKEAQDELLTAISDATKKHNLKVSKIEREEDGKGVIVTADKPTRKAIDGSLHKLYNLGYIVINKENFSIYKLR